MGWVEEDGLAFNAAYGEVQESSTVGTWRRPTILGHGAGGTEPSRTVRALVADCPRLSSGLSARQGVTILPPKINLFSKFRVKLQKLKRERKVRYLDKFVATQDTWIEQILPSPK